MLSEKLMAYLAKYGEELDVVEKEETKIKEFVSVDIHCTKCAYVPIKIDDK
ncbi:hypothetical protein IKJ53_06235 [bacterium]|nr:hypothetical protein [bacterium]